MRIICSCGNELGVYESGVNGTDFFECKCGKSYNVLENQGMI